MKRLIITLAITTLLPSCTQQQMAKDWGGTTTIDLPVGKKLVTVSWEQAHLWYLLRDARPGETPETLQLKESSSFGVMQGQINFVEH
jgi:hypothetical protein